MVKLEPLIDHTLLAPEAGLSDIERLCAEAAEHRFASVCVNPCMVRHAAEFLRESAVPVCTVIGFPLGASATRVKSFEAGNAMDDGAHELDMVMAISAIRENRLSYARQDIEAVVKQATGRIVKVIMETCLLTNQEKVTACRIAMDAGAAFVKTSTGFSKSGATVEDIRLVRKATGPLFGVKASGGIRSLKDALAMINAGANRIGTSNSLRIITEQDQQQTP